MPIHLPTVKQYDMKINSNQNNLQKEDFAPGDGIISTMFA